MSPKQLDCKVNERRAKPLSAHTMHIEALARLRHRTFRVSKRLSGEVDFRIAPSLLDEKSCRQTTHRSHRQFPASPLGQQFAFCSFTTSRIAHRLLCIGIQTAYRWKRLMGRPLDLLLSALSIVSKFSLEVFWAALF